MSEERNQNQQEQPSNLASWEAQLQARANEILAQRAAPLKAEIERLQANISEISSRLSEQESAPIEQDSAGLLEYVKQWFSDSTAKAEEDFKHRLEEARAEAARAAHEEAERGFQSRLELACAEAAAVARRESEAQLEDLREQLEASRKALTLAVSSSQQSLSQTVNFEALKTAIEDIDSQRTQSDTLSALVRRAAQFAPRVAFFVVKSGDAVGWKASGFDNGLNDETVKLLTVPSQKQTLLRDALMSFRPATGDPQYTGDISAVLGLYSSPVPERAIAIPLMVFNKAAAVLYADSGTQPENSINTAVAESLTRIAGRAIELLLSRRGTEPLRTNVTQTQLTQPVTETSSATDAKPAVQQSTVRAESDQSEPEIEQEHISQIKEEAPSSVERETAPQVEQIKESAPDTASEVTDGKHKTEELPPLPETAHQDDESLRQAEAQLEEPTRVEAESELSTTEPRRITKEVSDTADETFGASQQFEPPSPPSPPAPPEYAQQTFTGENTSSAPTMPISDFSGPLNEERPAASGVSAFQSPPPAIFAPTSEPLRPAQPVTSMPAHGVPTPGSETEQRAHNDARRFARLLVSEIKLYNAAKVNDGRRNYDLYDRLKDEIDRSRKVYDKRVAPAVAARFDYFYDELVQTLAEGDPAKLGKNCPGPVVLA